MPAKPAPAGCTMIENTTQSEIEQWAQNFRRHVAAKGDAWDKLHEAMLEVILAGYAGCSPEGWCWVTPEGEAANVQRKSDA